MSYSWNESASTSAMMRSRAVNLPIAFCFSMALVPPPKRDAFFPLLEFENFIILY